MPSKLSLFRIVWCVNIQLAIILMHVLENSLNHNNAKSSETMKL